MRTLITVLLFFASLAYANIHDDPQTFANRTTMVHLFEWKWNDIAEECENFLSQNGYGAVQISPPQEHIWFVVNDDVPWYVRYQPVSFKLNSRSGNESELEEMIKRCNRVGVRVVADVVLNHMVGIGQKSGDNGRTSSGGSYFDGTEGNERFPAVPFGPGDLNDRFCNHDIANEDYGQNAYNVKTCRLVGLLDLDQGKDYVRFKIREFLNRLIDIGVAGFRFDASKHMWPDDLKAILSGVKNLRSDLFGSNKKPFVVHEVIDRGGEAVKVGDYITAGRYTNFNFGSDVTSAMWRRSDLSELQYMGPGFRYGNLGDNDALNFIDNHDNQREHDRYVVTYRDGVKYSMAVAYMLLWNYGYPRVMSSYAFDDSSRGPPNYGSSRGYETKSPRFDKDGTCHSSSGFVCEHRWPEIRRMVMLRSAATGAPIAAVNTGHQFIAFARKGKAYIALSNNDSEYTLTNVETTLGEGIYCDLVSGEQLNGRCTGKEIHIGSDGHASFTVPPNNFVAFGITSKL